MRYEKQTFDCDHNFPTIGGTFYFRDEATGKIMEVSARVRDVDDWNASPQADDPMWSSMQIGNLVLAVKLLG